MRNRFDQTRRKHEKKHWDTTTLDFLFEVWDYQEEDLADEMGAD